MNITVKEVEYSVTIAKDERGFYVTAKGHEGKTFTSPHRFNDVESAQGIAEALLKNLASCDTE